MKPISINRLCLPVGSMTSLLLLFERKRGDFPRTFTWMFSVLITLFFHMSKFFTHIHVLLLIGYWVTPDLNGHGKKYPLSHDPQHPHLLKTPLLTRVSCYRTPFQGHSRPFPFDSPSWIDTCFKQNTTSILDKTSTGVFLFPLIDPYRY